MGERWDQEREGGGTNVGKERKTYPHPPPHPFLTAACEIKAVCTKPRLVGIV